MNEPLLSVADLDVVYHTREGSLDALHRVTFDVQPGEIVGIVGESGGGKSTVASSLLRLLPPNGEITGGQLQFKGRDLVALSPEEMRSIRGPEVAMIFQDPLTSLNPTFTVGAQLVAAQRAHHGRRIERAALRRRAVEMLETVGIPDPLERIDHFPHQFSGGMRQRIMIAMALLLEPALLIADEATTSLDVTLEAQILELLRRLRRDHGTAILFISHDLGVVAETCDRVVVMYAGRVVEQGDVVSIFEEPRHPYTRALFASFPSRGQRGGRLATIPGRVPSPSALPSGCKFADRCSYSRGVCQEEEPPLFEARGVSARCYIHDPVRGKEWDSPVGEATAVEVREPIRTPAALQAARRGKLLRVVDLRTYFHDQSLRLFRRREGAVRAVDGVDLTIDRREVVGLVGESGSGKTTLGETILRLVPATSGQVVFDGEELGGMARRDVRRLRRRMQMIFQDPYSSLSPRRRVASLLMEAYKVNDVPPNERYSVPELLEMVELSREQARKYPHELSGGQARRVGIARALALHPELIVADEPTAGLDVSAAASVLNMMKDLGSQLGLAYLIITHNLNVVGYIADRIAVMYLGQIVEVGPTDRIFDSPAHPYTRALLSAVSEPDPQRRLSGRRLLLPGEIPSPRNPPPGCRFHTRCPYAEAICRQEPPVLEETAGGHQVACHFWSRVIQEPLKSEVGVNEFS